MSRLTEYIQKEGRGNEISKDKALELIHKNCSKSLKAWQKNGGYYIQRNTPKDKYYYYVNPSKSKELRTSANTRNYYTLIIDNSPLWKQYPKRSKSLICLTGDAQRFFHVFPYDGLKIGICPEKDMWFSWKKIFGSHLNNVNNNIYKMFLNVNMKFQINIKSLKNFKIACKTFDEKYEENGLDKTPYWFNENYNGDLYKTLIKLMSPKNDNFKLMKSGDKLPDKKEAWIDGECIMVKAKTILVDILKNE